MSILSYGPMSKGIIYAAYHEAGHVLALLLTNKRFKYVDSS
jgi:hypothetical protein